MSPLKQADGIDVIGGWWRGNRRIGRNPSIPFDQVDIRLTRRVRFFGVGKTRISGGIFVAQISENVAGFVRQHVQDVIKRSAGRHQRSFVESVGAAGRAIVNKQDRQLTSGHEGLE